MSLQTQHHCQDYCESNSSATTLVPEEELRETAADVSSGDMLYAPGSTATADPDSLWLAFGFVLAGIGTVMLGPVLPRLSTSWGLSDEQGGMLLAAKFIGAFLGGVSVPRRLRLGVLLGTLLCCAGFGCFAFAPNFVAGALTLFVAGFGLGQIIASTNILVGRRYTQRTGSALALLNFFWSFGAVITGLLAAVLLPRFGLREPLLGYAALFVLAGGGGAYRARQIRPTAGSAPARPAATLPLSTKEFLYFALLLFVYGGLETSLSGWITTYSLRFSDSQWLGGQAALILMWSSLTAGRALTSLLMRTFSESLVRNVGLLFTLLAILGLLSSSRAVVQLASCVFLGLSLSPFFPASFARLMRHNPSARLAGVILAVSGLGAALFPWLVGVVSNRTGSLRLALLIPFALTAVLFIFGMLEPRPKAVSSGPVSDPDAFSTPA